MRPQTLIKDIADDQVLAFLRELAMTRDLDLCYCKDTSIFNFMGIVFDANGKGGRITNGSIPVEKGILESKIGKFENTPLHDLLQSLCRAGGDLKDCESKTVISILNDTFSKMYRIKPRKSAFGIQERKNNLIRLRRANGDL